MLVGRDIFFLVLPASFALINICLFYRFLAVKRIKVAFLSIVAAFIQLFAYGIGFIHAVFAALILKRPVKGMFVRNFYK